jgi:2-amino-4-hydroxy-6-hydroxymethyldihydropteridine diphosphokinase
MTDHTVYIGLGSNLGDSENNLRAALSVLDTHPFIAVEKISSFYTTAPLGPAQADFVNAVVQVRTSLAPGELLQALHLVEHDLGRRRGEHWGPRTIDLDILLYSELTVDEPGLTVPHPQMHLRSFVLKGLCELAGDFVHPRLDCTLQELHDRLNGRDFSLCPERPQLVSIAGTIGVGKTTLAAGLVERLGGKMLNEKYDENPYLADVYAGHTELALDSELFFLSSSAAQLRKDRLKPGKRYVSDYVFDKALIYASGWLSETDLQIYRKHYESIMEGIGVPVLVIYLYDSMENCLQRIHQRNRPYEQQIEIPFLQHLARGYDALYTDYVLCPVLRIRPDECRTDEQVDRIARQVQFYLAKTD